MNIKEVVAQRKELVWLRAAEVAQRSACEVALRYIESRPATQTNVLEIAMRKAVLKQLEEALNGHRPAR